MRFRIEASVGNADGVFDAAYEFGEGSGEEAAITGTPREIGDAVARYLSSLAPEDCQAMRYGTPRFFIQLVVAPDEPPQPRGVRETPSSGPNVGAGTR
jgi:hypothetical protein